MDNIEKFKQFKKYDQTLTSQILLNQMKVMHNRKVDSYIDSAKYGSIINLTELMVEKEAIMRLEDTL